MKARGRHDWPTLDRELFTPSAGRSTRRARFHQLNRHSTLSALEYSDREKPEARPGDAGIHHEVKLSSAVKDIVSAYGES
jgi:hypothetical protein